MRSNLHVYKWLLLNSTLFCTGFFSLRDLWKEEVFHKCSLETLPVPPEMIQRQEQQFIASNTHLRLTNVPYLIQREQGTLEGTCSPFHRSRTKKVNNVLKKTKLSQIRAQRVIMINESSKKSEFENIL